jgi:hypothetical protein
MKNFLLLLAAFSFAAPAFAEDVPENFEEAILRESADDQGKNPFGEVKKADPSINPFTGKREKKAAKAKNPFEKVKSAQAEEAKDLPEGFEEAILGESADDQGFEKKDHKKETKAEGKRSAAKAKDMKKLIAEFIKYNELHGDEQPATEDECVEVSSTKAELSACLEVLGLHSSVVSSRHAAHKKTPGSYGSDSHEKASMDFKTD